MNRRQFLKWSGGVALGLAASAVAPRAQAAATPHYQLDPGRHTLTALDPDGAVRWRVGGLGTEPGRFNYPCALATDGAGRIYVLDRGNQRVQVLDADGGVIGGFAIEAHARDLAVDAAGRVGVVEATGAWRLYAGGRVVAKRTGLARPVGVAVTPDGHWHVLEADAQRVLVLDAAGRRLAAYGAAGQGPGRFAVPTGIASDARGRVAVLDGMTGEIHVFANGRLIDHQAARQPGATRLVATSAGWQPLA